MEGNKKKRKIPKFVSYTLILLVVGSICLYFSYPSILRGAGEFLAPDGTGKAEAKDRKYDAVILENEETVRENAVKIGMNLLSSGKANRLVIVYQNPATGKIFGLPANFDQYLTQRMEGLGLRRDQIKVIPVPGDHPITLTEASVVLSHLSKEEIRSVILLTEGFHTRRSYWAYKQVGAPMGVEVVPYPYFINYKVESWWEEEKGVRNFFGEAVKFIYYIFRGYIPIKSIVGT